MIELDKVFALDALGLLLMGVYSCFLFALFFVLLKREKLNSLVVCILVMASFLWPLFFFIVNEVVNFKSTPPDSVVYASIIQDFGTYFNFYSFGVKGYSILNFLQYQLCFKRPFVFVVFNIFYYQVAVLFVYKAFKTFLVYHNKIVDKRKFYAILVVLSSFYPITVIINASILRESMALMFLAIFSYLLIRYIVTQKGTMLMALFVLTLVFVTRPLTGVCSVIALFLGYCYKNKLYSLKNFIWLAVIIVIVNFSIKTVVSNLYQLDFNMAWLISYRDASNARFGTEGYSTMNWSGPFDYVKNVMFLVLQYLLSPLPILVSPTVTMNKLIPLIDSFYIIFVLITPILLFYKKYMKGWLLLFLIFLVVPALFETNISGAYRHRISAVFFLIPLVSYIMVNIKLNKLYVRD
ncbi:hypothetical protein [Zobellia galactanivorans]|uniref:O antigen biosynthesis protein WbeiA n=1 Tax=Zobellia galactanivorans (strain DSM 12802 / CCUG 47099 / CIP 106680 / NCIMB 13871 / Dsij) TaxID=63186 RepID=G0L4W2_ZOBGA|nr:hypothetical protein [Zobellia galactanivorans]CAZ95800.1 O antigen biosynthesis protein WbeiA [Zobellia galactanivorans]